MKVIKRNGSEVEFDKRKISNAIAKAMKETERGIDEDLAYKIADKIELNYTDVLTVEEIQNLVEESLMLSSRLDVAKTYIRYRYKRELERDRLKRNA